MTPRPRVVLCDVNGTLTDPSALGAVWGRPELGAEMLGEAVRSAMVDALLGTGARPFSDHLASAIEVLAAAHDLDPSRIEQACRAGGSLPPRPGAAAALAQLRAAGMAVAALTNSGASDGARTLEQAGLADQIDAVIGVDAVATFKPDPPVYAHALTRMGRPADETVLLATHPWDLAGGDHAGLTTAWVTHGARAWPRVHPAPDLRSETLEGLAHAILGLT